MLDQGMREQAIGKAELARRLGWHLPQVDRVLDVRHRSRLDRMDAALGEIGCRLEVRARDDASMAVLSASTSASPPKAVGIEDQEVDRSRYLQRRTSASADSSPGPTDQKRARSSAASPRTLTASRLSDIG